MNRIMPTSSFIALSLQPTGGRFDAANENPGVEAEGAAEAA